MQHHAGIDDNRAGFPKIVREKLFVMKSCDLSASKIGQLLVGQFFMADERLLSAEKNCLVLLADNSLTFGLMVN